MVHRQNQPQLNWPEGSKFHNYGAHPSDPCTYRVSVTLPELGEIILTYSAWERMTELQVEAALFRLYESRRDAVMDCQQHRGRGYW